MFSATRCSENLCRRSSFFSSVFGAAMAPMKRHAAVSEATARKRRPAAAPKKRPAAATEARARKRARVGTRLETRPATAAEVAGQWPAAAAAVAVQGLDATGGQAPATRWPSHPPAYVAAGERALLLLPGDGWSMRESTSRPGFFYYFNDRSNRYATLDAHSLTSGFL